MDNVKSFSVPFSGGLVNNVPEVDQGVSLPGTARKLVNFEPALSGGYRRIEGYSVFNGGSADPYPIYEDNPHVVAITSSSTPSSLSVYYPAGSGSGTTFQVGDYFSFGNEVRQITTITGLINYYSIAFSTPLSSAVPAGFHLYKTNSSGVPLTSVDNDVVVMTTSKPSADPGAYFYYFVRPVNSGSGLFVFPEIGSPTNFVGLLRNGTNPAVDGAGQTGTTLVVDGLEYTPNANDTFYIPGLTTELFRVDSATPVVNGQSTITLNSFTALPSSPNNNASIIWISSGVYQGSSSLINARFGGVTKYRKGTNDENIVVCFTVDVNNTARPYPMLLTAPIRVGNNLSPGQHCYQALNDTVDLQGATTCAHHKNQLFFGNQSKLIFSAPYNERDYTPAGGGGVIDVGNTIIGLKSFRETLYIFCTSKIFKLVGNTAFDFALQPVTENIGCAYLHTIQEVGGDIMFLAEDGLRLLSATERIGDINLAAVSRPVQKQVDVISAVRPEGAAYTAFVRSIPIKDKSQYRIFRWQSDITRANTAGILAAQTAVNNNIALSFAETKGIKVKSCDFSSSFDRYPFTTGEDAYLYFMDSGNRFAANSLDATEGIDIPAVFATPYFTFEDTRLRKTLHKVTLYVETDNTVSISANLKLDFENTGVIQPSTETFNTGTDKGNVVLLVGNGFSGSLEFSNTSSVAPFTLESATVEYALADRR